MTKPTPQPAATWLFLWPILALVVGFPVLGSRLYMKILLVAALTAWGAWNWRKPEKLVPYGTRWLPLSLSLIFLSLYTWLGLVLYSNYSNYFWGDIVGYLAPFSNSKGWLPGLNNWSGLPLLAQHSEFLCIPLGWLFKIAPYPATIQLAQAACSLLAWVLFRSWLLKRSEDKDAAEWIAFGFALTSALLAPILKGFHPAGMAMPAIVLTATAFHDGKFRKFILSLILLLLVKEVFTLTAMCLGGLALLQKREAKWIWAPFAMGLFYGLFLRFWFFPMMLPHGKYFYAYMIPKPAEVFRNYFLPSCIPYLAKMILWGGGAWALRSPYLLMAIPPTLLNLGLGQGFDRPNSHYSIEIAFWVFFGGVTIMEKGKWNGKILFSFLFCLVLMNTTILRDVPFYFKHQHAGSYQQALDRLPPDAVVALAVPIDDYIWKTRRYYTLNYTGAGAMEPCTWTRLLSLEGAPHEYAVLHRGVGMYRFSPEEKDHMRYCWDALKRDSTYTTVWEDSVITLIQKRD